MNRLFGSKKPAAPKPTLQGAITNVSRGEREKKRGFFSLFFFSVVSEVSFFFTPRQFLYSILIFFYIFILRKFIWPFLYLFFFSF